MKRTDWFNFGVDPNPDLDARIFFDHSSPLRDRAKNYVSHEISKCCGRVMTKLGG